MITSENLLALSSIINRMKGDLTDYDITVSDFHGSWKITMYDGNNMLFTRTYSYEDVMKDPEGLAKSIIDEIVYGYTE